MTTKSSVPEGSFAQTIESTLSQFTREQKDIAFGASALRTGTLSERQLSKALAGWTIHGNVPLKDHLLQTGLINEDSANESL